MYKVKRTSKRTQGWIRKMEVKENTHIHIHNNGITLEVISKFIFTAIVKGIEQGLKFSLRRLKSGKVYYQI